MNDEYEPTREEEEHSHLLGLLDSTGGTMSALLDGLEAAEEAGYDVQSIREIVESADGDYQEAFNEVDSDDPDPVVIEDGVTSAKNALASAFDDIESSEAHDFDLSGIDSGVYDTLSGYAEYCYRDALSIMHHAEQYRYYAE